MDPHRTIAAAILIGGRAVRLAGAYKGALAVGGRPILDRQLDVLRAVADPVFAVSSAQGPSAAAVETIRDALPGGGALVGIYSAIAHAPRDRTLVVACDMPFLSSAFLRELAAVKDADLVIPRHARGHEPLCAIYSRACAEDIRERLARGVNEASRLPVGMRVTEVDVDNETFFVNVNTPHDYERAKGVGE